MQQLPVFLARHWIDIFLPKKADLVRLLQLVDGHGIGAKFSVIQLDSPLVLLAAMDGFHFFFSLDLSGHLGSGNRQPNEEYCGKKQQSQKQVSLLARFGGLPRTVGR